MAHRHDSETLVPWSTSTVTYSSYAGEGAARRRCTGPAPAVIVEADAQTRMSRAACFNAFTMQMGIPGAPGKPDALATMVEELFSTQGHIDPVTLPWSRFACGRHMTIDRAHAGFLELPFAETFVLVLDIQKYDVGTYEWRTGVPGAEPMSIGLTADITSCLVAAGAALGNSRMLHLEVSYRGTKVGTYTAARLEHGSAEVANGIMEMVQHLQA